ncbi:MAG: DUF4143 domain-containing protein, partial [bacterium]|nr:DUF4143 domain-containing protein [bacterium]
DFYYQMQPDLHLVILYAILVAFSVVHVLRPFSSHRPTEIVSAPKVYAFDMGFVCYHRGWYDLRRDDLGILWEHFVLNEMHAVTQSRRIGYWRNKQGHEIDFVLSDRRLHPITIECKWSASEFSPANLLAFRRQYPEGRNYVVAGDVDQTYSRTYNDINVHFVGIPDLLHCLQEARVFREEETEYI